MTPRRGWTLLVVTVLLACLCAASVMVGSRSIPLHDLWTTLRQPSADPFVAEVIRSRVPRTVLGLVSGAALALSGALMQALTRNPLADPGILGINSGAALAVLVGIAHLGLTAPIQYVWLAVAGATAAAALVWLIGAGNRSRPTPVRLALAGAIVTAVLTGFIQMVLLPHPNLLQSFRTWQAGSLSGPNLGQIATVSPLLLVGVVLAAISAPGLNTLALGEDLAAGLGTRVTVVRVTSSVAAVLLAAGTTALTGPIGFVGLIAPHAVRAVVGPDNRRMLSWCAICGPVLVLASDVLGRVITRPADVAVGIVTAIIGAPVFIALIRCREVRQR